MSEKTGAPRVAQRDDTPASHAKAPAVAHTALRPTADNPVAAQPTAASGAANDAFYGALLRQLAVTAFQGDEINKDDLGFICSVVNGTESRDLLEYMLVAQMAVVHIATMTSARRLRSADTMPKQDSAERAFNKLARTFATQMEALTRYRTGGEQKVVQNVSVSDGGQAIVGNVTQAPRASAANGAAPRT